MLKEQQSMKNVKDPQKTKAPYIIKESQWSSEHDTQSTSKGLGLNLGSEGLRTNCKCKRTLGGWKTKGIS